MSEERVLELEHQLIAANEAVAKLTLANAELVIQVANAESRNKKLKRNARNDENSLQTQLAVAISRRS